MKIAILVLCVLIVASIVVVIKTSDQKMDSAQIGLDYLPQIISALHDSTDPMAFLIITHRDSGEFLQFKTVKKNTIEMDFPVITDAQKSKASGVKDVCQALDLPFRENHGSDGSTFYDWEISGDSDQISEVILRVIEDGLGFDLQDQFHFESDGFPL